MFAEEEAAALAEVTRDPERLERLARREAGEPLEQIVGWVDFGGLRLAVGPGVFVPPALVAARSHCHLGRADPAGALLLEACAGAAPIATAVARSVPRLETHASDIDPHALRYARRNLPDNADVHCGHLLEAMPHALRARVTLLVAVPPYVPLTAAALLPREAIDHEPARALFGGLDGPDHLRALVDQARPWLAPQARMLIELQTGQYQAAARHAERTGFHARLRDGDDGQTALLDLRIA